MKASSTIGKVTSINLVDDTTEMMVISQIGKNIRIDTKSVRSAGCSTAGVLHLHLRIDTDDKAASGTQIPPKSSQATAETERSYSRITWVIRRSEHEVRSRCF